MRKNPFEKLRLNDLVSVSARIRIGSWRCWKGESKMDLEWKFPGRKCRLGAWEHPTGERRWGKWGIVCVIRPRGERESGSVEVSQEAGWRRKNFPNFPGLFLSCQFHDEFSKSRAKGSFETMLDGLLCASVCLEKWNYKVMQAVDKRFLLCISWG